MKLYMLKPIVAWNPWYDKVFGIVVRAENETEARTVASIWAGDEGGAVWHDPLLTTCEVLEAEGNPGMIIKDFASA